MVAPSDLTLEQYADNLRGRIGTQYHNVWSVDMFGPNMPGPHHAFNTGAHRDSIWKFVDAVGDVNPLYRDDAYAAGTRHGVMLAPPTFLYSVAYGHYPNPEGYPAAPQFQGLYAGDDYEWFDVIRAGDEFDWTTTIPTRVELKQTKSLGQVLFLHGMHEFRRRGEAPVIARARFWTAQRSGVFHGRPEPLPPVSHTPEYIRTVYEAQDAEIVRGATPRHGEDVSVGDELQPVVRGPFTLMESVAWKIGAVGERYYISDRIGRRIHEHTGWGEWDEQLSIHKNFHEHSLTDGGIGAGAQRTAWIGALLTNWVGDDGFVQKLHTRHVRQGQHGNVYFARGRVRARRCVGDLAIIDLTVEVVNHAGVVFTEGEARVLLPTEGAAIALPLSNSEMLDDSECAS